MILSTAQIQKAADRFIAKRISTGPNRSCRANDTKQAARLDRLHFEKAL